MATLRSRYSDCRCARKGFAAGSGPELEWEALFYKAKILKFPERRSEFAKLRAEIEEMRVSVRAAEAV